MKVICSQESLSCGIQVVQKGLPKRLDLPIYNGVLFETLDDKVRLFATDLEIGIDCYIPAQVTEPGSTVLPSRLFTELIKRLPEGNIKLETSDNVTTIQEKNSKYKIMGYSSEEFYTPPETKIVSVIKLKQKMLKEAIRQTIFGVSQEENRSFLNGALFKVSKKELEIVSTDGHRLCTRKIKIQKYLPSDKDSCELIIPYRALVETEKLLLNEEELTVEIRLGEKQVIFILNPEKDNVKVYSRVLEGEFPDYRQIIPASFKTELKIDKEELKDKIERVALFDDNSGC